MLRDKQYNTNTRLRSLGVKLIMVAIMVGAAVFEPVNCQLPDDIQRELNQNLAEQARIQAMRQQHQKQIQNRVGQARQQVAQRQQPPAGHDPNNYSYQQVSPPIQYSYYQPYGDAATPAPTPAPTAAAKTAPQINFDLNNLNFDLPQPQAQVSTAVAQPRTSQAAYPQQQQHYTPSFTGAGGLPVLKPVAAAQTGADTFTPAGNAPLQPQAQQGPPLTEADFKDITGGENYGAPGGSDFGVGAQGGGEQEGGNRGAADSSGDTDAQLREFGMPAPAATPSRRQSSAAGSAMSIPDFGSFNPIGGAGMPGMSPRQRSNGRQRSDPMGGLAGLGGFEGLENMGGAGGGQSAGNNNGAPTGADFDFASQPSSNRGDQAAAAVNGGAPGSLQSLLGAGFPGLGGGGGGAGSGDRAGSNSGGGGLDEFASGLNDPQPQQQQQQQRSDDGALDIADMGEKSDQFSGADLGGFEQPSPQNDQDYNYASGSNQQPSSVPYPDGNPQPVGTLLAITQPQSLTQTRYNALPDKGTYQDYPAYQAESGQGSVTEVVDNTPRARSAGPGRYGAPSPDELAPDFRESRGRAY